MIAEPLSVDDGDVMRSTGEHRLSQFCTYVSAAAGNQNVHDVILILVDVYNRSMATRKSRSVRRTVRPGRPARKKRPTQSRAVAPRRERRRGKRETLRLRAFEPTLTVNDIERSVKFYTDVLGFVVIEQMTDGAVLQGALLKAGVCTVGLSQDDWAKGRDRKKGEGVRIWCRTAQDIDAMAARITAAGGQIDEAPKNQPWGVHSLSVKDPDGFLLTIYREREG